LKGIRVLNAAQKTNMSINDIYIEKNLMDQNHNIVKNKPSENGKTTTGNKNKFKENLNDDYFKFIKKLVNGIIKETPLSSSIGFINDN